MIYFSDIFGVEESILEEYGAMNISLLNDIPLFIDPFLLYASEKQEYKALHNSIIDYLSFLKEQSEKGELTIEKIKRWYVFPEVKQNWLGYSQTGNSGAGLGVTFGQSMNRNISNVFSHIGHETVSESSHLEKISLFRTGVGRDNVSDFTCNLIKDYLLWYTEEFAIQYLKPEQCQRISVSKAVFDYQYQTWEPKTYYLPYFNGDYVILTPKELLTKDENWINLGDMKSRFLEIAGSVPNDVLRDRINDVYSRALPQNPKGKDVENAVLYTLNRFPELMDYYIKIQEEDKAGAKAVSDKDVIATDNIFIKNVRSLVGFLLKETNFYEEPSLGSYEAAKRRVLYLKDVIENKDGYKLFYNEGKPIKKEKDLQTLFKFTWFGTAFDVNAEVNNGRGPVDFKVSMGAFDKTLVEFKLAKNSKLKQNLQNQVVIYEAANDTRQSIKAILYFNESEYLKVKGILKELHLEDSEDIILIDACDNKQSASNVKSI